MAEEKQQSVVQVIAEGSYQVGKYTVRRWTIGHLPALAPHVVAVRDVCREKGVTAEMFEKDPLLAVSMILPFVAPVIAVTLGISEEEARGIDMEEGLSIALLIVSINLDYLRKLFGPTSVLTSTLNELLRKVQ